MIGFCYSTKGISTTRNRRRRAAPRFAAKDAPAHTAPAPTCSWQWEQGPKEPQRFAMRFRASEES